MAGFVLRMGGRFFDVSDTVAKPFMKFAYKKTATLIKPVGEYVRGFVKNAPKQIPLGNSGATTSTVTTSLRAGMQTNYLAKAAGKKVLYQGPQSFLGTAKYLVRTALRDTLITPIYAPIYYGYKSATVFSHSAGYVGKLERYGEKLFLPANAFLHRFGLAPTPGRTGTSVARISALTSIGLGVHLAKGKIDAVYERVNEYVPAANRTATPLVVAPQPNGDGPVLVPHLPVAPPVAVPSGNNAAPHIPVKPAPLPEPAPREYIPLGRRR